VIERLKQCPSCKRNWTSHGICMLFRFSN